MRNALKWLLLVDLLAVAMFLRSQEAAEESASNLLLFFDDASPHGVVDLFNSFAARLA